MTSAQKTHPLGLFSSLAPFRPSQVLPMRLQHLPLTAKQLVALLKLRGGGVVPWHDGAINFRTRHSLLRRRLAQSRRSARLGRQERCPECLRLHDSEVFLTSDGEILALVYALASTPVNPGKD